MNSYAFKRDRSHQYSQCFDFLLQIRDGPDETSPLIEHYCGYPDLYPAPAISTGNAMFIQFESTVGTRKPGSGFRAVWNVGK